jgi:hypothetical protein
MGEAAGLQHWLVTVAANSSAPSAMLDDSPIGRQVLEVFVESYGLLATIVSSEALARRIFGNAVIVDQTLENDPELGGDFVNIAIRAGGVPREKFRELRRKFFSDLSAVADRRALDRLVFTVERG